MGVAVDQARDNQSLSSINDCSIVGRLDPRRPNGLDPALINQDIGCGCSRCLTIQNQAVGDQGISHVVF